MFLLELQYENEYKGFVFGSSRKGSEKLVIFILNYLSLNPYIFLLKSESLLLKIGRNETKSSKSSIDIKSSLDSDAILERIRQRKGKLQSSTTNDSQIKMDRNHSRVESQNMSLVRINILINYIIRRIIIS